MRHACLLFVVLTIASMGWSATPVDAVAYDIQVRLDPATHRLTGTEVIRWTNTASVPTGEIWWHLYLNAFAGSETTFMKEVGGGQRNLRGGTVDDPHWGWTRITSLTLDDGTDLLPELSFERPDDGNPDDYTVARTPLPAPVPAGGAVILHLEFEAQLPRVVARTGWAGDFHLVGQWFPKPGVFEDAGVRGRETAGWNCHQFHASSEFYADFATWDVTIEVPEGWVLGATGLEMSREAIAEGTSRYQRVTFHAEHVHDFAWTTAPDTLMMVVDAEFEPGRDVPDTWLAETAEELGVAAAELELPPVHLRLIIPRSQDVLVERTLRAARLGLAWYGLKYGPWPYPQLTIVDPPITAREAGGMEYPMFITTGGSRWMRWPPMKWIPLVEMVTIHEFGHQYFYGLVATNEFEEAWMDEGFNSFSDASCSAAIMRDHLVPELKAYDPWTGNRLQALGRRLPVKTDRFAWEYRTRSTYSFASYTKTALILKTLQGLAGSGPFFRAMRAYVDRWRFAHPGKQDFFTTFNEVTGRDWSWFFDQAFEGDAVPDFGVARVRQREVEEPEGFRWDGSQWVEIASAGEEDADGDTGETGEEKDDEGPWTVEVHLVRRGSFRGPVEVELAWDDGTVGRRIWDGEDRWTIWSEVSERKLDRVVVDPDGDWALEVRREDNYWSAGPQEGALRRRLWWMAELFQMMGLNLVPWS